MKSKSLLLLLTLVLGLAINLSAAPAETTKPAPVQPAAEKKPATEKQPVEKGPPKPYPLDVCIVTDNDLDSMGDEQVMVYKGQTIKFCCKPCEEKFLKNPAKYLEKLTPKAK